MSSPGLFQVHGTIGPTRVQAAVMEVLRSFGWNAAAMASALSRELSTGVDRTTAV